MAAGTIRERRTRTGLSIRQMEARTGINRGRLSIIERGVTPTFEEYQRIEHVLAEAEREEQEWGGVSA